MTGCQSPQHPFSKTPLTLMTRRGALKTSLGTVLGSILGPTLPRVFAHSDSPLIGNDKSVILLWLDGGPSQHDSFDPKTSTDAEFEFRFKPVSTTADSIQLASCLPKLSQQAHHVAIIRSMQAAEMEHNQAQYHMQTGWRNVGPIQAPAIGSIVSHELGQQTMLRANADGLPGFISIGRAGFSAGYLGAAHQSTIVWDPNQPPENLGLPDGVSAETFQRRLNILALIEQGEPMDAPAHHFQSGRNGAARFMRSTQRAAFDLSREPDKVRDRYGRSRMGQGCLLARRLVEAGVRFVQVAHEGMDQHADAYPRHEELLRQLDQAMAQLIGELDERGLLQDVVVVAAGEFGRTPRINANRGRDHWIDGFSVAVAGGGFAGGVVYGSTGPHGGISTDPVTIPDFMATLCHAIGIDPDKVYHDEFNRPIKLVDDGQVIREVLA